MKLHIAALLGAVSLARASEGPTIPAILEFYGEAK
jgi:hypothetical protein